MHLQLRTIYFFSILLCFQDCTAKDVRLANPATPEEGAKQGVVAFGIYFCATDDGYLKFPEMDSQFSGEIRDITLVQVISIDHKNKILDTIPVKLKDEFIANRDLHSNLVSNDGNAIHTILVQDTKKKYAIESFRSYVPIETGYQNKRRYQLLTCPLNVYESFKALPIQANAGEVKFLGIFNNGDGLVKPNPNSPLCNITNYRSLESDGWRTSITRGDKSTSKHKLDGLETLFFLGSEIDPKNAELKFLRDFIDVQKEGYWRIKAEERLAALGYKYENGFLIEVEAKKK